MSLYGAFVWAREALNSQTRRFSARAVQNIWNTNYVLWYPFLPADRTIRSRFELAFI